MPATFSHAAFAVIALCSFLVTGSQVYAEMISYRADLKGTTEVPPNDSKGTGTVDANYDTASKKL